jgi:glycosyltransferase involved in cell wall biosynthesis
MRVLLASSSSGSQGGGELFLLSLGRSLAESGHHPILWASDHPRMQMLCEQFQRFGKIHRSSYVNTYDRRLRNFGAALDFGTAKYVASEWVSIRPDVVHVNKQNLEDAPDLLRAANQSGLPAICTIHVTQSAAFLRARQARLRDLVARQFLRGFAGPLVAIGKSRQSDLQRFVGADKPVFLVSNGVPIPQASDLEMERASTRSALPFNAGQILILGVGRMVQQKRPLLFLEIARRVADKIPNSSFIWVGDGPLRSDFEKLAAALGLSERILVTGWISDAAKYYAAADFFLHTAEFEGLPLALLEAMAAGLPIAVTKNLAADFSFLDQAEAIIARSDSSDWAQPIADDRDRKFRGSSAYNVALEQFSLERMTGEYLNLYQSILHADPVLHSS